MPKSKINARPDNRSQKGKKPTWSRPVTPGKAAQIRRTRAGQSKKKWWQK